MIKFFSKNPKKDLNIWAYCGFIILFLSQVSFLVVILTVQSVQQIPSVNPYYLFVDIPQLILVPIFMLLVTIVCFIIINIIIKGKQSWFKKIVVVVLLYLITDFIFYRIFVQQAFLLYIAKVGGGDLPNSNTYFSATLNSFAGILSWLLYIVKIYWSLFIFLIIAAIVNKKELIKGDLYYKDKKFKIFSFTFIVILFIVLISFSYPIIPGMEKMTILPKSLTIRDRVGLEETRKIAGHPIYYPNPIPENFVQFKEVGLSDDKSIKLAFEDRGNIYRHLILYIQSYNKISRYDVEYKDIQEFIQNGENQVTELKEIKLDNNLVAYYFISGRTGSRGDYIMFKTSDNMYHSLVYPDLEGSNKEVRQKILIKFANSLSKD